MPLVAPDAWRPRGIADLEPNAWHVLRRQGNTCVVAGPGGARPSSLAQRAAYLLETGTVLCAASRAGHFLQNRRCRKSRRPRARALRSAGQAEPLHIDDVRRLHQKPRRSASCPPFPRTGARAIHTTSAFPSAKVDVGRLPDPHAPWPRRSLGRPTSPRSSPTHFKSKVIGGAPRLLVGQPTSRLTGTEFAIEPPGGWRAAAAAGALLPHVRHAQPLGRAAATGSTPDRARLARHLSLRVRRRVSGHDPRAVRFSAVGFR